MPWPKGPARHAPGLSLEGACSASPRLAAQVAGRRFRRARHVPREALNVIRLLPNEATSRRTFTPWRRVERKCWSGNRDDASSGCLNAVGVVAHSARRPVRLPRYRSTPEPTLLSKRRLIDHPRTPGPNWAPVARCGGCGRCPAEPGCGRTAERKNRTPAPPLFRIVVLVTISLPPPMRVRRCRTEDSVEVSVDHAS